MVDIEEQPPTQVVPPPEQANEEVASPSDSIEYFEDVVITTQEPLKDANESGTRRYAKSKAFTVGTAGESALTLSSDEWLDSEESFGASAHKGQTTRTNKNKPEHEVPVTSSALTSPVVAQYVRVGIFTICFVVGLTFCCLANNPIGGDIKISQTFGIAIWISALWLTELVPLVVTAFMPLFLFPMFGILGSKDVASAYINNTIFLFVAGMIMALALERWDLHKRFSLKILSWCGAKPGSLLFGMMTVTFLLSMFVSNTATALMMVPNAISVCESIESQSKSEFKAQAKKFGIAVMLGIAYSANVGGMASLIGTPPNLIFKAQLDVLFPDAPEITFAEWLLFGLPIGLLILVITWVYLKFLYLRSFRGAEVADRQIFINEYKAMGAWTFEQICVGILFVLLAVMWVFRSDLEFSSFTLKGWANIFPESSYISDATIGMCFAVIMFLAPARASRLPKKKPTSTTTSTTASDGDDEETAAANAEDENEDDNKFTTTLMDWQTANKMPYDIIFLFGGGFALAKGFVASGLSAYLGEALGGMNVSFPLQVFLVVFLISWITCLTSNTATSSIMIPISASIALGAGASPYSFMIPAAFACSCAFCLPVATPPNMVVFASGRLPMVEMMRAGVFLNVLCSFLILGATFTLIPAVLDVEADEIPEWAENVAI